MLQLHISFPSGRYCAASIDDAARPEWPPHPSRVYSALVAAAYNSDQHVVERVRELLISLEEAGPPTLVFPEADTTHGATSYVPTNDLRSRFGVKSHGPFLPNRQPRHFPAAYLLGKPEIIISWPLSPSQDDLTLLDQIASHMTHLGTSHSLVVARFLLSDSEYPDSYVPDLYGDLSLRVPLPGRLQELDELHSQRGGNLRRPQPLYEQVISYARLTPVVMHGKHSAFEWLVFRLLGCPWGADTAHTLAKSLRRAIMALLDKQAPASVHGHDPEQLHVAWLPLSDVGHHHADGKIRGIGIGLPNALSSQERNLILDALSRLAFLRLPHGQFAKLEPVMEDTNTIRTLRRLTWVGFSTCWSTVTPVILDRPPKRFDSDLVLQALVESLVNAGFPQPVSVRISQTSDFDGAPSVRDIPTKLPRIHARIVFAEPVQGPVIAGRLKYFGVGFFRPTPSEFLP